MKFKSVLISEIDTGPYLGKLLPVNFFKKFKKFFKFFQLKFALNLNIWIEIVLQKLNLSYFSVKNVLNVIVNTLAECCNVLINSVLTIYPFLKLFLLADKTLVYSNVSNL